MLTPSDVYALASPFVANLTATRTQSGQWITLGTGSGFLVDGKLVTCAHNLASTAGFELSAIFPKASWLSDAGLAGYNYQKPLEVLKAHSVEHSFDYAVLDFPAPANSGLVFSAREPLPGEPVCSLGYAFDSSALLMHQGIIAGVEKSGVATMLSLDMSVNPGNSGGPLISLVDGKVLGVVVRKATGLTTAFDQLISTMKANIEVLRSANGGSMINGIDPIAVFNAIQTQMLDVSMQIKRSAMVGIGYAIHVSPLKDEPVFEDSERD